MIISYIHWTQQKSFFFNWRRRESSLRNILSVSRTMNNVRKIYHCTNIRTLRTSTTFFVSVFVFIMPLEHNKAIIHGNNYANYWSRLERRFIIIWWGDPLLINAWGLKAAHIWDVFAFNCEWRELPSWGVSMQAVTGVYCETSSSYLTIIFRGAE
jgi:hypothetical protein